MSLRKIDVQYVGNCLRMPRLERDVAAIETDDGRVYKPVETCRIEPDPDASRACMGPMLRCDECGASFPRINLDYRACPNCAKVVER